MNANKKLKRVVKQTLYRVPIVKKYTYGLFLYRKYRRSRQSLGCRDFLMKHRSQFHMESTNKSKATQIARLLRKVDICPVDNDTFFYSIDCMKMAGTKNPVFGNCAANYDAVVNGSFQEISDVLVGMDNRFGQEEQIILSALRCYLERCKMDVFAGGKYSYQLKAIESLFQRPAESLFEGLQRVLFFNQFLWQTGHTLNGLGHLDWILEDLYRHDLDSGTLTHETASQLLKAFFRTLHENYWFKSAVLMGDTGQIVILGGRKEDGRYHSNDLTYLFIEVAKELRLPDPKVLLRCTADMPEDLIDLALECISTGIGAPLLSNDDEIIPDLLSFGFDETDVYHYGTAACWEPLIPGISCDANNIASLNFAIPLVQMLEAKAFAQVDSLDAIMKMYEEFLHRYIEGLVMPLTKRVFEEDPLLSLVSPSALEYQKDITQGGAKYNNLGLTSVGMGTVVNSLLNMEKLVFREKRYTLEQMNEFREQNYAGQDGLVQELRDLSPAYGSDAQEVVDLTRRIMSVTSMELNQYQTKWGGKFKVGLSSPSYIIGASSVRATFDGRKDGEPLGVHISSGKAIPTTELLSFAMKLDYLDNRINGNVIDFITTPGMLRQNRQKYAALLRTGFDGGIFQLQMNVVDSKTLIAAKADPTLFPSLVVRVWGFSAYFNDLPVEYKDVLIARAIESEKAA